MEAICWYAAFVTGIGLFLAGIIYLVGKKDIREEHFAKAALFEFLAGFVMYIPQELFNDIPPSLPFLKVVESLLTALLRTFSIYMGNGYERISYENHPVFSGFYATVLAVSHLLLLVFIAGFIVKFFEGPFQQILLSARKKRYSYVFYGCNEKTLAIAESLHKSTAYDEKSSIVFAVADTEFGDDKKRRIREMKGIFTTGSMEGLIKKLSGKTKGFEVFLFGDSEENNLIELEQICSSLEEKTDSEIRIYVELSETPWNLYDDFLKEVDSKFGEKLIINFVRTEENFVFNDLMNHSIFANAVSGDAVVRKDSAAGNAVLKKEAAAGSAVLKKEAAAGNAVREIRILLVGMNERNIEMFRAVMHLGQMPGYRLNVMVIEDGANRDILRERFPEIKEECDVFGDAFYRIIYRENVDYGAAVFDEIVKTEYPEFTFAFVNAGNDILNANIAMRLNAICRRMNRKSDYVIQANIKNRDICKRWNKNLTENIEFVGSIEDTYDYGFITMSGIEKATVAIHNVRYPDGSRPWYVYCNNEYNRHSVYARTLSFKYKVRIIDEFYQSDYSVTSTDEEWKIYEHMRWNMYTRAMGYRLADPALLNENGELDRSLRTMAKVHNCLVPYDDLSDEEKQKDSLVLTPEIVEILKS